MLESFERDLVSERTTAALAHKRRNGERTGGIPFGYRLAADHVKLVPLESEQLEAWCCPIPLAGFAWMAEFSQTRP